MNTLAIYNPQSKNGNNARILRALREKFGPSLSVEKTAYPSHATEIARKAALQNVDTIIAVGGDGTVNEIINGIAGSDIALGIIPAGTANDLASLYNLPTDVSDACDVILQGNTRYADVIQVNDRLYATAGGFGFPCEVARIANEIRKYGTLGRLSGRLLGSFLYVLAFLIALIGKDKRQNYWTVRADGFSVNLDALWLMVNNQPSLGKNFLMSPGAVNDDGLFDTCLVQNSVSRLKVLSLALKVTRGKHVGCEGVTMGRYQELLLSTQTPIPFFGDGQVFEKSSMFRVRILSGAMKVIVPASDASSNIGSIPVEVVKNLESQDNLRPS